MSGLRGVSMGTALLTCALPPRSQAQGAEREDVSAHIVSETFALEWAKEAFAARTPLPRSPSAALLTKSNRGGGGGEMSGAAGASGPRARVEPVDSWRHVYCSTLVVRESANELGEERGTRQLHLLVWWLDGNGFEVVISREDQQSQVELRVTYDSTISMAYPMYSLRVRNALMSEETESGANDDREVRQSRRLEEQIGKKARSEKTRTRGGSPKKASTSAKASKSKTGAAARSRRRRHQPRGEESDEEAAGEEGASDSYGTSSSSPTAHSAAHTAGALGNRRYPVVRGAAHRLTFRLSSGWVELYLEGVLLSKVQWRDASASGSAVSPTLLSGDTNSSLGTGHGAALRASVQFNKTTRLFWAWRLCREEAGAVDRGAVFKCARHSTRLFEERAADDVGDGSGSCESQWPATGSGHSAISWHHVWSAISAAASSLRRPPRVEPNKQPWFSQSMWLEWRTALTLPVSSTPVALPKSGDIDVRYIEHHGMRCANEVNSDLHEKSSAVDGHRIGGPTASLEPKASASASPGLLSAGEAKCAALCSTKHLRCIGYRYDNRTSSSAPCVLMKALRSTDPDACDMKASPAATSSQAGRKQRVRTVLLSLREHTRRIRKPFREPSSFEPGDSLHLVGVRSQLSNVPTKIIFSLVKRSVPKFQLDSNKPLRKDSQREKPIEAWALFIDWKRHRTQLASQKGSARWVKRPDLLQSADDFPFVLGESYQILVNRTADRFIISSHAGPIASVPTSDAIRDINLISITGSAVERATITYSGTHWRVVMGQTCVNTAHERSMRLLRSTNYSTCQQECAQVGRMCTGFSLHSRSQPSTILSGLLHHLLVDPRATGDCQLQGALKTKTISACDLTPAPHWKLNLKILRIASAHWYNVAMAASSVARTLAAEGVDGSETMPCVLRESTYQYCWNPLKLSKENNDELMENLFGAWWSASCKVDASGQVSASSLHRLDVDPALKRLGLIPELATEDAVLVHYRKKTLAFASLISIKSWDVTERRANQKRRPFVFDLANPGNGSVITCDFRFGRWEKNWIPFVHEDRLLAIRWFNPHSIIEVWPSQSRCELLHATPHPFARGIEAHGGTPPVRFDRNHYLALVRFRTGGWARNNRETRHYANIFYLFEARPPFGVTRVSSPFTLPSCVHQRLGMHVQVAKSLVQLQGGDYLLCWGELDCYSCCSKITRKMVYDMLSLDQLAQHPS